MPKVSLGLLHPEGCDRDPTPDNRILVFDSYLP